MRHHVPETGYQTVRANGLEFAYFAQGEGPLVLLIHGFPDTAHTWDDILPAVAAAGFRAVAPFLAGYVPSEIPKGDPYDLETLGRNTLGLIEALGEERAILVGHDWGAASVYSAAALAPERVAKLVPVAVPHMATLKPGLRKLWGVRHFLTLRLPGAVQRFARDDYAKVDALYARWSPTWEVPEAELEPTKNAFAAPGCANAALGYYRRLTILPPRFLRNKIPVPTLAFGGEDDPVVTEADYLRAARMFTAGYRVQMIPGGHFLHREAPEAFLEHLLAFLRS